MLSESAPDGLPEAIERAFEEGLKSHAAGAPNAALCMWRRALDEALTDLEAPKGNLPTRLDWLVSERGLAPDLREWADHARIGGKLAAHGTGGEEWGEDEKRWGTQGDSESVRDFLLSFLEYVYVMPKRNAERRAKAEKKTEE
jgi:hypothetical protein